ncbi:nucleoside phosphatase family-domain-containing protein [Gymnopilus junonius]|uniref:guanosine-diphosphatase n=1 Tax=Gymnopilus junonius TaxID=109634 RepID=A0A9P5TIV0_GYMJU|nr:nucleoside phosphatase family-domain-containing protein [Gymnopilus junonius]
MVNGTIGDTATLKRNNSSKSKAKRSSSAVKVKPSNISVHRRSSSLHPRNHLQGVVLPAYKPHQIAASALRSRYHYSLNNIMSILSPRSSNYERLEGGHGPSRTGPPTKRLWFGWKKFAVAAVVLIGLVYFFGPRERRLPWKKAANETSKDKTKDTSGYPYPDDIESLPAENFPDHTPPSHQTEKGGLRPQPPALTTYCTTPHSPHAPLTQWALMIDAGSTYEVFKMTQPGLSSFTSDPVKAAESLMVVPKEQQSCTPVRLLRGSQSSDIMREVEARLRKHYPFHVPEKDGVVIMDGKDEGVYAWITANYLLKTINADTPADTPTYAVLDLGGGSTQIVFEPSFTSKQKTLEEGEHKYELNFGGRKHTLYQHSYLGYGLMQARNHVHTLVEFMASLRVQSEREKKEGIVGNPCLARGTKRVVELAGERTGKWRKLEACGRLVQLVLAKDAICEMKPCSFNGVYQPSLLDSFQHGKLATLTCLGPSSWSSHPLWSSSKDLLKELEDRPEWCLDLTFMHALLRLGYEFEDKKEVMIGKKVGGTELGWCLGAAIELCRDNDADLDGVGHVGLGVEFDRPF